MPQKKKLPFVTVGFVAVNVLVYVILEILGNTENSEFMVRMGAVWPPYVEQENTGDCLQLLLYILDLNIF